MERNTALIMHEVAFGNDRIEVIEQGNELLVTMKPLCERIGLDWESQRQLIQRDEILREVACTVKATSIGKDGKNYPVEMVSLPIQYLNGWLFKVDPVRYEGELKEKLIRYKKECYQVLFERFFGKRDDYSYVDELERRTKAINAELKALKADDAFKEKVKRETADVMRGKKKIEDLNGYPKLKQAVEERLNDPATHTTDNERHVRIMECFTNKPDKDFSPSEISALTGDDNKYIGTLLARRFNNDEIDRVGRGRYRIKTVCGFLIASSPKNA